MSTSICKLCLQEKVLRNSHILPEFMYQYIYDTDIKRFLSLQINITKLEDAKRRIEQKGIREYLLCQNCETLLSTYENYAAETIYGKNQKNQAYIVSFKETPDQKYFTYDYVGFDYKRFKIFLLSILWRLVISKSFNTPEINHEIQESLRVAILNENPLEYDDFGCLIQVIKYKKDQLARGYILSPFMSGKNDEIFNILIDGFMYSFYLANNDTQKGKSYFLKKDGTMIIIGKIVFEDKQLFEKLKTAFDFFYIP